MQLNGEAREWYSLMILNAREVKEWSYLNRSEAADRRLFRIVGETCRKHWCNMMLLSRPIKYASDIWNACKINEKWYEVRQFDIMWIIEPGRHRNSIVWMEYVGRRWIVQYYGIWDGPS